MSYYVWCGHKFSGYYCEKCLEKNGKPTKEDDKMSDSKIHVLPDENLGGVLREYVEVDRHPKKEDYVYVSMMDGKEVREIAKVIDDDFDNDFSYETIQLDRYINGEDLMICSSPEDKFATIEPTDIVHIDGQRYRLVDRKAKVGEKVIYYKDGKSDGVVTTCTGYSEPMGDSPEDSINIKPYRSEYDEDTVYGFSHGYYRVLEPVEPSDLVTAEEGDDKSVLDLLANLARRVTELERQQKENREYIIKAFEGISGKDDEWTVEERVAMLERTFTEYMRRVNTIESDIEELNTDLATIEENAKELERAYETLKRRQVIDNIHVLKRRQERLFEEINAIYRKIDGIEADVQTALGDIVMLDERTQPLVALVKAVKACE